MKTAYEIVAQHYAASDRKDIDGMMADLADDVQWTEMAGFPCAGTYVGREAIVGNVFAILGRDWEGFNFTLTELIDGGDTVVGVGDYKATNRAIRIWFARRCEGGPACWRTLAGNRHTKDGDIHQPNVRHASIVSLTVSIKYGIILTSSLLT
jgi:uncharacterized protein